MKRLFILGLMLFFFGTLSAQTPNLKKDFLERYKYFITKSERKAFEKLTTDKERQKFIDNFWQQRDPNQKTPENEFRDIVESRFKDIENEVFKTRPEMFGLTFGNNGKLNGDMARVYLLHGMPTGLLKAEGRSFVDLFLWIYQDADGLHKFRFLFYRRSDSGSLRLFFPYFSRDLSMALQEISRFSNSPDILSEIYRELFNKDFIFLKSLTEFSDYAGLSIQDALKPPGSVVLVYKRENPITNPTVSPDAKLKESKFSSLIPLKSLVIGSDSKIVISMTATNTDWLIKDGIYLADFQTDVNFQNIDTGKTTSLAFNSHFNLDKEPTDKLTIRCVLQDIKLNDLPRGPYRVNVYVRNVHSNKYVSYSVTFNK